MLREVLLSLQEEFSSGTAPSYRICPFRNVTGRGKEKTCSKCIGGQCRDLQDIGLDEEGQPLPTHRRARCGAKTRKGSQCQLPVSPGKRRCRYHGGLSTGPKSASGRARIAEAQRNRWAKQRSNT
ncbi:HGGxSTG domain-containing protein [Ruegeria arenilitoris]|uniref:HGGxSTG domain-containing protein n=1 Tax=Ruegeria arenilitoris TaxID=1173585 RepID=UPI0026708AA6|nr:HGGxSTG domain-containing protein [Ruegeria arenilitoris]